MSSRGPSARSGTSRASSLRSRTSGTPSMKSTRSKRQKLGLKKTVPTWKQWVEGQNEIPNRLRRITNGCGITKKPVTFKNEALRVGKEGAERGRSLVRDGWSVTENEIVPAFGRTLTSVGSGLGSVAGWGASVAGGTIDRFGNARTSSEPPQSRHHDERDFRPGSRWEDAPRRGGSLSRRRSWRERRYDDWDDEDADSEDEDESSDDDDDDSGYESGGGNRRGRRTHTNRRASANARSYTSPPASRYYDELEPVRGGRQRDGRGRKGSTSGRGSRGISRFEAWNESEKSGVEGGSNDGDDSGYESGGGRSRSKRQSTTPKASTYRRQPAYRIGDSRSSQQTVGSRSAIDYGDTRAGSEDEYADDETVEAGAWSKPRHSRGHHHSQKSTNSGEWRGSRGSRAPTPASKAHPDDVDSGVEMDEEDELDDGYGEYSSVGASRSNSSSPTPRIYQIAAATVIPSQKAMEGF